ncbi:hypothetical protein DFH08DRAFT_1008357, partial [Mycena albidolilacea]
TNTLPSIGNPLGSPVFPGDTGGGGETFFSFDPNTYNRSLILTYDYAVGGAVVDPVLVPPITLSLPDEVDEFLGGAAKKPATAPWTSENALFSIWIGVRYVIYTIPYNNCIASINDNGNTFYLGGDRAVFSDTLPQRIFHSDPKTRAEAGGRNFLFITPLVRLPSSLSEGQPNRQHFSQIIGFFLDQLDLAKTVIEGFNSKLAARVKLFQAKNRAATTWIWDAYTSFNTILDPPQRYRFVDDSCFGELGDSWG